MLWKRRWIEKLNGKEEAYLQFRKSTLEGY